MSSTSLAPPAPTPQGAGGTTPTPPLGSAAVTGASATTTVSASATNTRVSIPPTTLPPNTLPPASTSFPGVLHLPPRRTLLSYALVAAACLVVYIFRQTLTMAFAAFATAYVFAPIVRRVERYGVPRPLAILLVLFSTTAIVAGVLSTLVPELLRQVQSLASSIPAWSNAIEHRWIPYLRDHWHMHIPPTTEGALRQLGGEASSFVPRIDALLSGTLEYGAAVVEYVFKGLVVFALTFYLLLDFETVLHEAFELVPHRARARVSVVAHEIDETLRHFVTGQLVVMGVLGFLYAVGLGVVGVPAGWAIGVFAGLISFVPYLGFFVALGLALFMTAIQAHGVGSLVAVTAVMTAVHILDLTLITPRILGGRAKISPVVTILALIAGGSVFGFVGVLVAIPAASVIRVFLREAISHYKESAYFTAGPGATALQSVTLTTPPTGTSIVPDPGAVLTPPAPIRPSIVESTLPFGAQNKT